MDTVLITGGTGHLGRDIAGLLTSQGHHVRILARHPGEDRSVEWITGDLSTGAGLAEAVSGVDRIVHAATNSPVAQRGQIRPGDLIRSPSDVDVDGTRKLLAEAEQAGVGHFLHVSIVGVQESRMPYSRVKAAAENVVRDSAVPWSIVAATPFYWLLARMMDTMAARRIWPLPSNLVMQPCDSAEFAAYVVECLADGPGRRRDDFAGPQAQTLVELARQYQAACGITRRIFSLPVPALVIRAAGPQTAPHGRHGKTTWSEWLVDNRPSRRS